MTARFVLDANMSPLTRQYLVEAFHLDVVDLLSEGLGYLSDSEVVAYAKQHNRVIVTLDLDFGEIYHRRERGMLGIIILRLQDQTIESVNQVLGRFFHSEAGSIDLPHSLVVIDERRVRITSGP